MIGVLAREPELWFVREFFELFKTPWEPARPCRQYPALLSDGRDISEYSADLHLVFCSRETPVDQELPCAVSNGGGNAVGWGGTDLPILGDLATLQGGPASRVILNSKGRTVALTGTWRNTPLIRVGFDLFREVALLLSHGQPAEFAATPTLELHVAILRKLILSHGVPLVEIPPRPEGCDFICCLTHDIDFHGLRRHRLDSTMWGFLYRATLGSLIAALRRRRTWPQALENWKAAALLPFVHLGWASDPWQPLRDYPALEGRESTFFVIPFKGRPGCSPTGKVWKRRASPYGVDEIEREISEVARTGNEIAVHGLDAWRDAGAGKSERARVTRVLGREVSGLRMHWLYYDGESPTRWEEAGFRYDSSIGYNDAVGFRAGTSQVYRLPGTTDLLELPLNLQDTALFFPDRMGLSEQRAAEVWGGLIETVEKHGGVLTVNWHDRSLAPERLWKGAYLRLLREIETRRVWFAKASEAVEWFAKRRRIAFDREASTGMPQARADELIWPPALIRQYRPGPRDWSRLEDVPLEFSDEPFAGQSQRVWAETANPTEGVRV